MNDFSSLTLTLAEWFDRPLCDLPDAIRLRVEEDLFPLPWDALAANQRRSAALQWDYQHDPATEAERKAAWDLFVQKWEIESQIKRWEIIGASTATDLAKKEERLRELKTELASIEAPERPSRGGVDREHGQHSRRGDLVTTPSQDLPRYIAFPKALALLAARLGATSEEIAGWVWDGPEQGGLTAYVNANELEPPPRFYFYFGMDDDYVSEMMACWFRESDITNFTPRDRYISGKALIERWSKHPGINAKGLILAKLRESRLLDIHPIYGGTREGSFSEEDSFPALETGLFSLSLVQSIEAEDFAVPADIPSSKPAGHLNHDPELQARANEIAKRLMAEKRRGPVQKDKVAKLLADERSMDFATVLRRIRKCW
jgi:hypothetical protein